MTAKIQWHSGTMRLWLDPEAKWGDPFDWACGIVANPEEPEAVIILGAMGAPPKGLRREIFEALAKAGFKRAKWQRGKERWTKFDLASYLA